MRLVGPLMLVTPVTSSVELASDTVSVLVPLIGPASIIFPPVSTAAVVVPEPPKVPKAARRIWLPLPLACRAPLPP